MARKTRAVFVPSTGDPYRAGLWLSSYRKYMKDSVDQLYACVNSGADLAVLNYTADLFRAEGAKVFVHDRHLGHNLNVLEMVRACQEELFFLSEDDFYIVEPGHVERLFSMIENGQVDAVGSPRGCCSQEMMNQCVKQFKITDVHPSMTSFWPALYLGKMADLFRIRDMNFGGYAHPAGEYIPELDWTPTKQECGDTFVWASIQLRALGLKFHIEDQGNWIDVWTLKHKRPWIHTGAGSSSMLGHLLTSDGRNIGTRNSPPGGELAVIQGDSMLWITETKQAVWELIREHFPIPADSPAAYFNDIYTDALQNSRNKVVTTDGKHMSSARIQEMRNWYEDILAPILPKK